MNKPDMSAFVGRDFDCEFKSFGGKYWFSSPLAEYDLEGKWIYDFRPKNYFDWINYCRPRVNKAQVLDDWSWIPDGFVWRRHLSFYDDQNGVRTSEQLRQTLYNSSILIECTGVEANKGFDEWAELHSMEIIEI